MMSEPKINTKIIALVACFVWFTVAWAIDKFWFTVVCEQCSHLFAFDFELNAKDLLHLKTDRVSAIFLFVVPFVIYFFVVVPYKEIGSSQAWLKALERWSRPFAWLIAVLVWVWAAESIYSMLHPYLPDFFTSYAEKYLLKISGTVLGVKELEVTGRLGALIGLIAGLYFFISRGVAGQRRA
jgi:hypothetical protein